MDEATTPQVNYRFATQADFPALVEMYHLLNAYYYDVGYRMPHPENVGEAWLDSFRRTLGRFSVVILAEVDQKVMGFMLGRLKPLPAYMGSVMVGQFSDMWVYPEARRLGVGEKLSRLTIDWFRQQNVHSVEVEMLRENDAIWRLYDRMGFQIEYRVARLMWEDYVEEKSA